MSGAISAAAIGAATSIGMGVSASQKGKAANAAASKTNYENQKNILKMMMTAQEGANQRLDPYTQSGVWANDQIQTELQPGGRLDNNYTLDQYKNDPGYTPMVSSLEELQNTPGYKFQLQQGQQGLDNQAAMRGGLLSGKQLKETSNYQQGVAAQGYQSAWERAQKAYQAAFDRNQSTGLQRYNQLSGVANRGALAANQQGQNIIGAHQVIASGGQNTAQTIGQNQVDTGMINQGNLSNINSNIQGFVNNPTVQKGFSDYFSKPNTNTQDNVNTGADNNLNNSVSNALNSYIYRRP